MCTLVAFHKVRADYPLVVVGNREELYARRTSPPRWWGKSPNVLAGVDDEKGGTWLGVSERGLYVGLTNQRPEAQPDPSLASRGEVVAGLLHCATLDEVVALVRTLEGAHYNPFNLLFGDGDRLFAAYVRGAARVELQELPPGIWVLPNDRIGSPDFPKIERATGLATPMIALPWDELVSAVPTLLADHTEPPDEVLDRLHLPPWLPPAMRGPLAAICVHSPSYGTRSATVAAIAPGRVARFLYADGPLCQAALRDYLALAT